MSDYTSEKKVLTLIKILIYSFCRGCTEERLICYRGANKIVRTLVKEKISASKLFKASIELFLTAIAKFEELSFIEQCMGGLSEQVFKWMEHSYGKDIDLMPKQIIMSEIQVRS